MKKISAILTAIGFLLSMSAMPAVAGATATDTQQPAQPSVAAKPDVVVTSFGGSDLLDFIELYNQAPDPVDLNGTQIQFTVHDTSDSCEDHVYSINAPSGWLLPKSYLTLERGDVNDDATEAYYTVPEDFLNGCTNPSLAGIKFTDSDGLSLQEINFPTGTITTNNWAQHKQRGKSSLSVTGVFANDYNLPASTSADLYSTPLYHPPINESGLEVVEILPHAFNCSPDDDSLLCSGYVKLFNSSGKPINLADYRLRTSYGGLKSSSSNTTHLSGTILPGHFEVINSKDDGSPLGLAQSGGYVWLEDSQGVQIYQPVITYPDASEDSKVGLAWAFNGYDWLWTTTPQPAGPNIFTLEMLSKGSSAGSSLKPCLSDQARSPLTNRCRKLASSTKALESCKPGQQRNPETGRCRSILSASKTKQPCKKGQERNPDTGRCRKVQPKINDVKDIKTASGGNANHTYAIAAIAAALVAYVSYEWNQEIVGSLYNIKTKILSMIRFERRQKT